MEEKIFSIVRNLVEYGYYQQKSDNAAAVLKSAFPKIEKSKCLQIVMFYQQQYNTIVENIDKDKSLVLFYYNNNNIDEWLSNKNLYGSKYFEDLSINHHQILQRMANFLVEWIIIR